MQPRLTIHCSKIGNVMSKLIKTWSSGIRWLPLLALLTISTSWTGCSSVKVISADQTETFLKAGDSFKAPLDGVFMPDARYQRYRRAVADRITESQTPPSK